MSINLPNRPRRVIPRWNSFSDAIKLCELNPSEINCGKSFFDARLLEIKEQAWRDNQLPYFALDLVSAASVLGSSPTAIEAAQWLLGQSYNLSSLALQVVNSVAGRTAEDIQANQVDARQAIRDCKRRRLNEPRNAFVWTELSRLYIRLGLVEAAMRPMQVALGLAPGNRYVIRAAVRYFLHLGEKERSLSLLHKSLTTPHDPWLLAAELAVSSVINKGPRFWKHANSMVRSGNYDIFHLSELSTAIGSIEMWEGSRKKAVRSFLFGLQQPTENALAQIVWAADQIHGIEIPAEKFRSENVFEALALDARQRGAWRETVDYSQQWAEHEGFSSRPYVLASAIASTILDNPDLGLSIAHRGLSTNPGHPALVNNMAFSLALLNRCPEAEKALATVNLKTAEPADKIYLLATCGLVALRSGKTEEGLNYYANAISLAEEQGRGMVKAIAQLHLSSEMFRIGNMEFHLYFRQAERIISKQSDPYPRTLLEILRRRLNFENQSTNLDKRPKLSINR